MFDLASGACVADNPVAGEPAKRPPSSRGVKRDEKCEGEGVRMRKALLPAMEGDPDE